MNLVIALFVSKTAPDQDFHLLLFAGFAPTHNFRNRSIAPQTDIALVEATIANTRRRYAVQKLVSATSHHGLSHASDT